MDQITAHLSLKRVIVASSLLALMLNVVQFAHTSRAQRQADAAKTMPTVSAEARLIPAKTGTVTPIPTPDPAAQAAQRLREAKLKPSYAALYLAVQARTGTPWQLLAAVHKVETGQAGSTAVRSHAGAIGPMQFMPATFRAYALDGDANGTREITDLEDAMYSAGNYLRASGADRGNYRTALYHYNHSWAYVNRVLAIANGLGL